MCRWQVLWRYRLLDSVFACMQKPTNLSSDILCCEPDVQLDPTPKCLETIAINMMPTEQGLPPGTCSEVALLFRAMSSCDLGQLAESCTSDLNTLFPGGNFGARAAIFAVAPHCSSDLWDDPGMYDSRIQAVLRNVLGKMELPLCWISHAEYLCGIKCEVEQLETVQLERGASTESDRRGVKVTAASACYGACGGVMGVVGLWGGAVIPLGIATTAGSLGFGVGSAAVVLAAGTAIIMVATPVVLFTVGSLGALYGVQSHSSPNSIPAAKLCRAALKHSWIYFAKPG
ncbi:hypothetical protein Pelo_6595 [Pelomyxa schiedti]|nr:hypothetical protein Pelo_6595 [Pelomyxa schiedti]